MQTVGWETASRPVNVKVASGGSLSASQPKPSQPRTIQPPIEGQQATNSMLPGAVMIPANVCSRAIGGPDRRPAEGMLHCTLVGRTTSDN